MSKAGRFTTAGRIDETVEQHAAELRDRIRRTRLAASSLPSPLPIERELLQHLHGIEDPEQAKRLDVAIRSMRKVWEEGKRHKETGAPWEVVAYECLRMMAEGFRNRRHTVGLDPSEEAQYLLVVQLMLQAQPEWEAFQALQRLKARRAEPKKSGRQVHSKNLWEVRIENLRKAWPKIGPVYGKGHWMQTALDAYATYAHEGVTSRTMERIIKRAQDLGVIPPLRVRKRR